MLVRKSEKVRTPKSKKNVPPKSQAIKGQMAKTGKLIRLDDLIPKENVVGGRQLLFGATDTTQPSTNNS
jgi:hypothetical protein